MPGVKEGPHNASKFDSESSESNSDDQFEEDPEMDTTQDLLEAQDIDIQLGSKAKEQD